MFFLRRHRALHPLTIRLWLHAGSHPIMTAATNNKCLLQPIATDQNTHAHEGPHPEGVRDMRQGNHPPGRTTQASQVRAGESRATTPTQNHATAHTPRARVRDEERGNAKERRHPLPPPPRNGNARRARPAKRPARGAGTRIPHKRETTGTPVPCAEVVPSWCEFDKMFEFMNICCNL